MVGRSTGWLATICGQFVWTLLFWVRWTIVAAVRVAISVAGRRWVSGARVARWLRRTAGQTAGQVVATVIAKRMRRLTGRSRRIVATALAICVDRRLTAGCTSRLLGCQVYGSSLIIHSVTIYCCITAA